MSQSASRQIPLADARSIAQQAFLKWMNPGSTCFPSISVVSLAPTESAEVGYDPNGPNENVIVFHDDVWPHQETSELAITTVRFDDETGEILDVDIEINTASFEFTPELLESVLTHEAGHFVGLGHSSDPSAVMYASIEFGMLPASSLSDDDARGICSIYPETGERAIVGDSGNPELVAATACNLSPTDPSSCGAASIDHGCSLGPRAGASGASGASGAGFAALAWAWLRRRRGMRELNRLSARDSG